MGKGFIIVVLLAQFLSNLKKMSLLFQSMVLHHEKDNEMIDKQPMVYQIGI